MPDITGNLLIDLDDSGAFATDLCASTGVFTSGFWKIEDGFSLSGRGRIGGQKPSDAAGIAEAVILLDNADGRFSPLNGSSPYQSGGVNRFRPYKQAHVKLSFNAATSDLIKGVITDIKIGPEAGDQLCEITIRDYMFVLSRTEIRRPLMLNQYTGVIIHCLLDDVEGAEGREACTNPSFETNLTGWTTFGTATNTRMTGDDKILEGPAAMRTVVSATNSGARHTMTGHNGLKKTLAVYVKPERDADIGAAMQIKMVDNVGTVATGTPTSMVSRDYWTRLEVSGTYNGGSTSQFIDIQGGTSTTQFRVGKAHCVPFVNAFARDIDDGKARLPKYSYNRAPALQAVQEVRENELGALFFFDGAGVAVFQDKHYRFGILSSSGTFDERGVLDFQESGDDRIKAVILDYPHYVDGVAGTEMFSLDRIISISPGQTIRVEADYQGGLARNTITPVVNIDYTITFASDGTGGNATASVTFTFEDYGGASVGTFTNWGDSKMVYLRTYKVRGTPVRLASDRSPARYTPSTGPALASTLSHDFQLNGTEPDIQAWAEYLGGRFSVQQARLTLNLSAPFPEAVVATSDMAQILARTVSNRVTVINDNLPFATDVNGDYHIDSIEMVCTGYSINAKWHLSPVDLPYYVIGDTLAGQLVAP